MEQTLDTPVTASTPNMVSRASFIHKTYNNLLLAIVGFVLIEIYLFQSGLALKIGGTLSSNWLLTMAAFMVISWIASRYAAGGGSIGKQYLGLFLFVLAEAFIFVPLLLIAVYYSDPSVLTTAVWVTIGGFGILTAIVYTTKTDFAFMRPFLMIAGIAAIVAIVGSILFSVTLGFYFSLAMVVFACAAVLHDTSKVLHEYKDGQHVAAALQLFSSVALLFYYVLMILVNRN